MSQLKKEEKLKALIDEIPEDRLYISVPEATLLFGIAKTTLYRLVRQGKIPAINFGTRGITKYFVERVLNFQNRTVYLS